METKEIALIEQSRALVEESMTAGVLSDRHIQARVNMIQGAIKGIFKKDVHFGVIPGTKKNTLYQPGADQLLVMFKIAAGEPKVEDLSTPDSIRYRVTVGGTAQINGAFLGAGVGECSSDEEKYRWRRPVCDQEFDETPEDRRREVWKKYNEKLYKQKQVRMNVADVANTVLKMAAKRAKIAMVLTVTGAADAFSQDLEDLSPEVRESVLDGEDRAPETPAPARASAPPPAAPPAEATQGDIKPAGRKISQKQADRFYAICYSAKKTREQGDAYLLDTYGVEKAVDLDVAFYDHACTWAGSR